MPKLRVHNLTISLDGYAAGPNQRLEAPLGEGGERLHEWVFASPSFRRMQGMDMTGVGAEGTIDDDFIAAGEAGIGATIMGRNMFGPVRGEWGEEDWRGWWGEDPPYHHPVFVLTHHPRPPIAMGGGTTFTFVEDGIASALERAFEAADGADVRLGGGPATIQQYLRAGLIDEIHLAIVPVLLGRGERFFDHLDGDVTDGYGHIEFVPSPTLVHVRISREATEPPAEPPREERP